jgi:phage terminase small subunit
MANTPERQKVKGGPIAGDPNRPLTPQQKQFVEEYLVDMNGSQAAIRAGYAKKGSEKQASQLLRRPHVRKALNERMGEAKTKTGVTAEFVINKIAKTIHAAEMDSKHNDVLRGCELLGRHLGMFVERTEISGKDGEAIQYEKVTEDAADFTSTIASLASRSRPLKAVGGNDT